jgi:hypothetical protein
MFFEKSTTGAIENVQHYYNAIVDVVYLLISRGRRGCDHMVIGFPTTCAISAYHHQCYEFEHHSGEVSWYNIMW